MGPAPFLWDLHAGSCSSDRPDRLLHEAVQGKEPKALRSEHAKAGRAGQAGRGWLVPGGSCIPASPSLFLASSIPGTQGCVLSRLQPVPGGPGCCNGWPAIRCLGPLRILLELGPGPEELRGLWAQASLLSRRLSQTCTRGWQPCHSPTGC